eukprot:scaffold279413_cov19-Tisochrysis_lutea.AAC.1
MYTCTRAHKHKNWCECGHASAPAAAARAAGHLQLVPPHLAHTCTHVHKHKNWCECGHASAPATAAPATGRLRLAHGVGTAASLASLALAFLGAPCYGQDACAWCAVGVSMRLANG